MQSGQIWSDVPTFFMRMLRLSEAFLTNGDLLERVELSLSLRFICKDKNSREWNICSQTSLNILTNLELKVCFSLFCLMNFCFIVLCIFCCWEQLQWLSVTLQMYWLWGPGENVLERMMVFPLMKGFWWWTSGWRSFGRTTEQWWDGNKLSILVSLLTWTKNTWRWKAVLMSARMENDRIE